MKAQGHSDIARKARDILLDVATAQLYRANAFHVLGLSVTADAAEISRRQKKLKILDKLGATAASESAGILPLSPPPDSETIRRAGQRLQNMQTRLVDELFWFWPLNGISPDKDVAFSMLEKGDLAGAYRVWAAFSLEHPDCPVAIHNLAVRHHVLALDREITGDAAGSASKQSAALLDKRWRLALKYWAATANAETVWTRLASRARELDDPRLTPAFISEIRQSLPEAILSISTELVVQAAKRGDAEQAGGHLAYIRESGLPMGTAVRLLEREAPQLLDRVHRICDPIADSSKSDPVNAAKLAKQVLADCQPVLVAIRSIDNLHQRACDRVAATVRGCIIDYANATSDWDTCLSQLEQAFELALGDELRTLLQEDIGQLRKTLARKEELGNLQPISSAPSLSTIYGCGFALYGASDYEPSDYDASDYDAETASHMATYYFVLLAIPVFPIARYRVAPAGDRVRFLGKARLRTGDKIHLAIAVGIIVSIVLYAALSGSSSAAQDRAYSAPQPQVHGYSPPPSPAPTYSSPQPAPPTRSYSGLSRNIESGKSRVRALESEMSTMDSDLNFMSARLDRLKLLIDGYETQVKAGIRVDEYQYQQCIDIHNSLAEKYNSQLQSRKQKYSEYKQEINSVNDMVQRYNQGER